MSNDLSALIKWILLMTYNDNYVFWFNISLSAVYVCICVGALMNYFWRYSMFNYQLDNYEIVGY